MKNLRLFLKNHSQLVRFIVVGSSGVVIDYLVFVIITKFLGGRPLTANIVSVETAIVWNFFWNNFWTFSKRSIPKKVWQRFLIFQFVSLGGLVLSQISLFILGYIFGVNIFVAKLFTIPLVAIFNYLVNSRWTFRDVSAGGSMWYLYIGSILIMFVILLIIVFLK